MPPYYDRIAKKWHAITGPQGGAVKRFLLNDLVIDRIPGFAGLSILELGAGNGYFLPLALRRFSGQVPARVVISDQSPTLLELAQRAFRVNAAEYIVLDAAEPFSFPDAAFDLIISNMMFNELPTPALRRALGQCRRVVRSGGQLLATVTHPAFVQGLARRGQLRPLAGVVRTMPGADGLRLPVVQRRLEDYLGAITAAGFKCEWQEVSASAAVLAAKPGLRQAGRGPIALLLDCEAVDQIRAPDETQTRDSL